MREAFVWAGIVATILAFSFGFQLIWNVAAVLFGLPFATFELITLMVITTIIAALLLD